MKKLISASTAVACMFVFTPAFADGLLPPKTVEASQETEAKPVEIQAAIVKLTEDEAADHIKIQKDVIPFKSKLKKRYTGYKVTVTSDYPGSIKLMSGNINNGFPGTAAYTTVETSKANMWWSALGGLAGIVVIGLPIMAVISHGNGKAERESVLYPNQIPEIGLSKGQAFSFNALVPLGQSPQINLVFKDPKSGLEFVKNSI